MKLIAVLITCHNRKNKTLACLEALCSQYGMEVDFNIDVFLVDDGSSDGTSEAIRSKFPEVYIIKGDGNLYWNRGMHLAWKIAAAEKDFDYYLWLNDDTHLFLIAIFDLLKIANKDSIIVGTTISEKSKKITYGGFHNGSRLTPSNKIIHCDSFNGNIILIPKNVFHRIGNLDYHFSHALGDLDYGRRAIKHGVKILLGPSISGYCEYEWDTPRWHSYQLNLIKRFKLLYSPLSGCMPGELFYFDYQHNGFITAMWHLFSTHIRLIFPQLWSRKSIIIEE